jgi:hypothetical protein
VGGKGEKNKILHVNLYKGPLINMLDSIPGREMYEIDRETFEQKISTAILDLDLIDLMEFIP